MRIFTFLLFIWLVACTTQHEDVDANELPEQSKPITNEIERDSIAEINDNQELTTYPFDTIGDYIYSVVKYGYLPYFTKMEKKVIPL